MSRFLRIAGVAAVVLTLLAMAFFLTSPPVVTQAQGWHDLPDDVHATQIAMAAPDFLDTPAGRVALGEAPKAIYLWQSVAKATGLPPPVFNQNPVGSCVSFGTSRAYEKSLAVQITLGERFEWTPLVEEVVYAGSRVEIGGGRLRGSDGSVGAWAARWVKEYGGLPRGVYTVKGKTYDLTKYDPARCRSWGDAGVPDDLEAEVRKYPAGDVAQVLTWPAAKKALAQGYGIAVCSGVGFNKPGTRPGYVDPATRDARGVCQPFGNWGHCMCLDGYHTDEAGKEYGHIENSWGPTAHLGPVGWGNPTTAGFWAEASVINGMLGARDSWAIASVKGFPARKIDWFALLRQHRDNPNRPDVLLSKFEPWRAK